MHNSHNEIDPTVTGVLLAGGASRRMGEDKATLVLHGLPLYRRGLRALAEVGGRVLIAGDRPDLATATIPCRADRAPGSSLGGLETALLGAETEWVVVLPCDHPSPSLRLLRALLAQRSPDVDAVVPRHEGGREPLIACYRRDSTLAAATAQLAGGELRLGALLDRLRVRYLDPEALPAGWRRGVRTLNTPDDVARIAAPPPAVTLIARSGTGKTTLAVAVIDGLVRRGWTIGALKHDAHRFEIDHAGKDTWRMTRAGAVVTAISSPAQRAVIRQHDGEPTVEELIARDFFDVDLVVTEGFKGSSLPKIEVFRAGLGQPLLCRGERHDTTVIAVAADGPLDLDLPVLDLNRPEEVVDFIAARFLR